MQPIGIIFMLLGAVALMIGVVSDPSPSIEMVKAQVIAVSAAPMFFIAGSVLYGCGAICDTLEASHRPMNEHSAGTINGESGRSGMDPQKLRSVIVLGVVAAVIVLWVSFAPR